jgi:hypothetical protein
VRPETARKTWVVPGAVAAAAREWDYGRTPERTTLCVYADQREFYSAWREEHLGHCFSLHRGDEEKTSRVGC